MCNFITFVTPAEVLMFLNIEFYISYDDYMMIWNHFLFLHAVFCKIGMSTTFWLQSILKENVFLGRYL